MSPVVYQQPLHEQERERERERKKKHNESKHVWKKTFHDPGERGSDLSTNQGFRSHRNILKVLESRTTSQPNETITNILCHFGCFKSLKIYGTKEDIDRIRKAGRICIARRSEHLTNKDLMPLASIVQLKNGEQNEDVA